MDLALNSDFSVFLDDRNDIAVVEGRAAFQQSVVVMLTDYMQDVLAEYNPQTIKSKLRQRATRVARSHDQIESIASITITRSPDQLDTYHVKIAYVETEDTFSTEISA